MNRTHVLSGIDRIEWADDKLRGRRVGLMTNPTGVSHDLSSTIDQVHRRYQLTALFAVEHGIRGDAQAGDAIHTTVDPETGVTVFSAYGPNSHFSQEMLDAFDVLVFDIQDVGARFYTYIYSLAHAMESCARAGKCLVVLDRVNPLGGVKRCGTVLDPHFASFVGNYELPTQYGLTVGEFARYAKDYLHLNLDLTVVPLSGWSRSLYLDDTDLPWVSPSPNCQNLDAALCYIGTCIFEGSNISEGRGTTVPFQVVGAPFLNGKALEESMNALRLPGLHFRRTSFRPTFSKFSGELCQGVQMHVTDRETCDCFAGGILLMDAIRAQAGEQFQFLPPQTGSVFFLDLLLGTDAYRAGGFSGRELTERYRRPIQEFGEKVKPHLLYD